MKANWNKKEAWANLEAATEKFAEFGIRFIPGSGQVVGIVTNTWAVIRRAVNNYQEAKQAKLTNLMLSECRRTQNPDDLYHTIKTGHVALLCFVISEYSRQEIERQDQVDSKRFFESSLEKLMGEIRGASTLIKEKAKSVQDDLRWRMGEADEGKDKDKEKAEIG